MASVLALAANRDWAAATIPDYSLGYDEISGVMAVILLPTQTKCRCESHLCIDRRPAIVNIYTTAGLVVGHSYHKKCTACGDLYYYSYTNSKTDAAKPRLFHQYAMEQECLLVSSKTCFQTQYLKEVSVLIEISAVPFTSVAENFEALHSTDLDATRLEEGYFLYKLLAIYQENDMQLSITYNNESCRKDLERVCMETIETLITTHIYSPDHQCDITGCAEGFVMADGIEKVGVEKAAYTNNSMPRCKKQ